MKKLISMLSVSMLFLFTFISLSFSLNASAAGNITLSTYSGSIPVSKSLYVKASSSSSDTIYFSSSDPSVARVDASGFVTGVSRGSCVITAQNSSGSARAQCSISVVDAEAVKFSYASPNNAALNSQITLYAITDKTRESVKFVVNGQTVVATSKWEESNTYVFTAKITATTLGESAVKVYSLKDGVWSTCSNADSSIFVMSSSSETYCSTERRRISDKATNFIAQCEGYVGSVYNDYFNSNVKTIGYGYVINGSDYFYSTLTERESYALLLRSLNSGFVNSVNNFLINNNIKFNQRHLDALSSFSYNIGTAWMYNDEDLRGLIFLANDTEDLSTGIVNSSNGLNLRSGASTSSSIIRALSYNTSVTILEYTNGWYKVRTQDGVIGYCCADYITRTYSSYNLNNIDQDKFAYEICRYHHAGGSCVLGLLYRRLDEMSIFFYGEYGRHAYKYNPHNFIIPQCIKSQWDAA